LSLFPAAARVFHHEEYGEDPFVVASAPGCVNIFGDFTEASEGLQIGFALSQRIYVALSPRPDHQVRFLSREFNEKKRCTTATLKFRREDRWANFPKGAIASMLSEESTVGLSVSVLSEVPPGIGLGSSQALTVASLLSAGEFYGHGITEKEAADKAFKVETEFVAGRSGKTSLHYVTEAENGMIYLHDSRTQKMEGLSFIDGPVFYIINSKVPLTVFETIFSHDAHAIEKAMLYLGKGRPGKTLRDFTRSDIKLKLGDIPENLRRRALFVVDEIARVQESVALFKSKDWKTLGKMMGKAHEGLRDLYEVSCPEIDWLVKRSLETEGVYGARMVSQGAGACVLILADSSAEPTLRHQLEEYERIFGFHPEFIPTHPSGKAFVHITES